MKDQNEIKEFAEFLRGERTPTADAEARVLSIVHARLNPRHGVVIAKLFLFHVAGSLVTLLFCPQFGISLTGKSLLMPLLMDIHPALCFFGCGLLWMLIGQFLSYAFLSVDEHRVIGDTEWGLGLSILGLSVLLFGCLGKVQFDGWLAAWGAGAAVVVALFNTKLSLDRRRLKLLAAAPVKTHP